ncbi:hypothetical protein C0989_009573 [Termitomyces sp. Mn162]|nr:hypothetical protein C0989_009573 [Termitomyces sp. Mn162]
MSRVSGNLEPKFRGANRSTKAAGKLKVLPEQPDIPSLRGESLKDREESSSSTGGDSDEGDVDENGEEQEDIEISLIPAGTARRDALKLTKKKAKSLPRVTAYATAGSYRMDDFMKFFNARRNAYHTNPKLIDEVIYTPYVYDPPIVDGDVDKNHATGDLLGIPALRADDASTSKARKIKFDTTATEAEIFLFDYGTVVIWGMTEAQEKRFLSSIKRFEVEKLTPEDVEMEDLNYYYANYSRTKLSLSHALSQSVKISLFEGLISTTIEETKDIPEVISETGKIGMPHKEIMQNIGRLFLLRTNINSVGSVLDSPEVFWSYPDLQPLYDAARSYLEIPQRIDLLNTRVEVLQDMLQLLKESVSSRHAERLERVVIALIAIEIVLGIVTILVDLMAY